jgi:hypothetical protein
MNAISTIGRNAADEPAAQSAERPAVDSSSSARFARVGRKDPTGNPFMPQTTPLRAASTPQHARLACAGVLDVDNQSWDRLFDQLIARVDAVIAARRDREASPPQNCQPKLSLYSVVDPGNPANSIDPMSQLKEVMEALVKSSPAGHANVPQDPDEPEWSDSDTAREMQSSIGQPR